PTLQFHGGATWTVEGSAGGLPAEITGFVAGDRIDIDGFLAVSDTFANNALVLSDTIGNHVTLGVQGSFASSDFVLAPDGTGGTNITVKGFQVTSPLMTNTAGALVFDAVLNG